MVWPPVRHHLRFLATTALPANAASLYGQEPHPFPHASPSQYSCAARLAWFVMVTVGVLLIACSALAATVSPWFFVGTGFIGAGLLTAGATGVGMLSTILMKMPWNRATTGACAAKYSNRELCFHTTHAPREAASLRKKRDAVSFIGMHIGIGTSCSAMMSGGSQQMFRGKSEPGNDEQ